MIYVKIIHIFNVWKSFKSKARKIPNSYSFEFLHLLSDILEISPRLWMRPKPQIQDLSTSNLSQCFWCHEAPFWAKSNALRLFIYWGISLVGWTRIPSQSFRLFVLIFSFDVLRERIWLRLFTSSPVSPNETTFYHSLHQELHERDWTTSIHWSQSCVEILFCFVKFIASTSRTKSFGDLAGWYTTSFSTWRKRRIWPINIPLWTEIDSFLVVVVLANVYLKIMEHHSIFIENFLWIQIFECTKQRRRKILMRKDSL